jgi:hypothetical protein
MTPTRHLLATAALLLAGPFAFAPAALAQSSADGASAPDQGGRHHHGPPPEAIAACQGKAIGTQASFTNRAGHTISGACTQMGDVVAVPPPAHRQGDGSAPQPQ